MRRFGTQYIMEEDGKEVTRFTGTIGDIGTSSFYPPHHMTMGEGGAVYTDNPLLNKDHPLLPRLGPRLLLSVWRRITSADTA